MIDFSTDMFEGDEIVFKTYEELTNFGQSFKKSQDILVIEMFLLRQISGKNLKMTSNPLPKKC